ncbi:hypothetical protein Dsin_003097 [Dipteronia sinensis]|uniref:DUF7950 domain-containing protein n=1 Tax=Dipteronia sinensis TaxID=43782 RepID=A0AAE0EK17_9ROSI|nr:hypothetical protein Dsin_003097 [Dipteronia sinensis]
MIKTLSPYNSTTTANTTEKTAEIMSRYRPIAPKPESSVDSSMSESPNKIRQSCYLRDFWPQLQVRPTRTRKRVRTAMSPPTFNNLKRPRSLSLGLSSPAHLTSPAKNLSFQGFAHVPQLTLPNLPGLGLPSPNNNFENQTTTSSSNLVTLSLLPCTPQTPELRNCMEPLGGVNTIDLNKMAVIPEEKDLLLQLQAPSSTTSVISPQPIRPVGSSITVGCISEGTSLNPAVQVPKKQEEVEEEVESETLPAIISDSNNKVRMANSAYKEMVGQPECSWLDCMVTNNDGKLGGHSCKRICGGVMLRFCDSNKVPAISSSSNGFSCWVRIEWGSVGNKNSINAFCDVIRLSCESKDYLFSWRFHTQPTTGETSQSSCDA